MTARLRALGSAAAFVWRAARSLARIQLWGAANFALGNITAWTLVLAGQAGKLALLKLAAAL